jgi:hypothetical protein
MRDAAWGNGGLKALAGTTDYPDSETILLVSCAVSSPQFKGMNQPLRISGMNMPGTGRSGSIPIRQIESGHLIDLLDPSHQVEVRDPFPAIHESRIDPAVQG